MIRESARSTPESNLGAASGLRSLYQSNAASYSLRPPPETLPGQWALCSFAGLCLLTSAHEVVLALPEFNSATRSPVSASQAACTSSSTLAPGLEISESARASCSSTDSDNACSSSFETSGVICAKTTSLRSFCRSTSEKLVLHSYSISNAKYCNPPSRSICNTTAAPGLRSRTRPRRVSTESIALLLSE